MTNTNKPGALALAFLMGLDYTGRTNAGRCRYTQGDEACNSSQAYADCKALIARADAAEAEAQRLRAALDELDAFRSSAARQAETISRLENALGGIANKDWSSLCADAAAEEMRDVARAALEGGAK